jgi:pimeloyl-ACP methyl ester carboxylesterase
MNSESDQNFPTIEGTEVTHRFIDIGEIKIHIAEAGQGEPLIMIHGWPQHWYMWKKQIPVFAKKFKVIAVDMRGFGWSDAPPKGYLKDELADDLVKLIHKLGYKEVRLLSHDWGGWVGFITAAKNPGLITQHFACNIPPIWPKLDLKLIPATIKLTYMIPIATPYFGPRIQKSGFYPHLIFKRGHTRKEGWTEEEMKVFSDRFKDISRAKAASKLYRDFLLKEYIPLGLGKYKKYHLKTPTYCLFGVKDKQVSTAFLRGYEKNADNITVERVEDAGHFIVDEKPDLVNERALKFLLRE